MNMAHAEICLVCKGSGIKPDYVELPPEEKNKFTVTQLREMRNCHGCNGKGWVEVNNGCAYIPLPYPVYPSYPILPCYHYPGYYYGPSWHWTTTASGTAGHTM
jgi:hypothetical protein